MNQFIKWRTVTVKVGMSCLLIGAFTIGVRESHSNRVVAQSPFISSEINSLKARITRLEQEVNRLRNPNFNRPRASRPPRTAPPSPSTPPPSKEDPPVYSPSYDRLATLLIELKEDVRNIEQRLDKIEARIAPN